MKINISNFDLTVNMRELNLISKALTGKLKEEDIPDARELGMRMSELRLRMHEDQVKFQTKLRGKQQTEYLAEDSPPDLVTSP